MSNFRVLLRVFVFRILISFCFVFAYPFIIGADRYRVESSSAKLSYFVLLRSIIAILDSSKFDSYQSEASGLITPNSESQKISLLALFQELHLRDKRFIVPERLASSSFDSKFLSINHSVMVIYQQVELIFAFCEIFDGFGDISAIKWLLKFEHEMAGHKVNGQVLFDVYLLSLNMLFMKRAAQ